MNQRNYTLQKLTRFGVAGAVAGFVGFLLLEPFTDDHMARTFAQVFRDAAVSFAIFGAIISLGLVLVEEYDNWHARRIWGRGAKALVIGAVGGALAGLSGQLIYTTLGPLQRIFGPLGLITARSAGWAVLGLVIGAATGLASGSLKKALLGLLGGLIGGGLGGFMFDIIGQSATTGTASRMIGFTVLGLATGLAIALVAEIAKQAWIKIMSGPKEGKEYILTKPVTSIGRDEMADIPLFGDMNVAKLHGAISSSGGAHVYRDQGAGSQINGQMIQQANLSDGDTIRVGRFNMQFRTKGGPSARVSALPVQQTSSMVQSNSCQFCGQTFDSAGRCACTVETTPSATPQQNVMPRLTVTAGPYAGARFDILAYSVTIGRDASNAIALEQDLTASRRHATLSYENGKYIIRDNGSSNGTFVNGARVTESPLMPGDVLQIGGSSMTLVFE